jgi:preprotein translocase subunit YajC
VVKIFVFLERANGSKTCNIEFIYFTLINIVFIYFSLLMKKTKKHQNVISARSKKEEEKNADIVFFILFSLFMRKKQKKSQNEV